MQNADGTPRRYKTYDEALKQAWTQVKTQITKMNPNILSLSKDKPEMSADWVKWLIKDKDRGKVYLKELQSLESQYWYKKKTMEQAMLLLVKDPYIKAEIKKS